MSIAHSSIRHCCRCTAIMSFINRVHFLQYTIQYVGVGQASKRYLKLNDCVQVYRLEMSTSDILPYPTDPKYAKCKFDNSIVAI